MMRNVRKIMGQLLKNKLTAYRGILVLSFVVLAGASLRILTCYWGYPYQLHPDEGTIVNSTIDMIRRYSYEPEVYNRPDHFEIKCCAVVFQIFSYIKYHVNAVAAFAEHRMAFYVLARFFTAFWGILTIIFTYIIVAKIRPQTKVLAASLVAFFPIFVQNSALATPDIVLTFFVLLIAYEGILYLENSSKKYLTLMCVTTGIGITCKYTCAIACIWIGVIICLHHIRKKKYLGIIKNGIFSISIVVTTCFFCAPNLFTNIFKTIKTLKIEARSVHLGADGLGFFGNLNYYLDVFLNTAGYEALFALLAGVFLCVKKRNAASLSMGLGLIFWICTSFLALHWERWGIPIYIFFVILTAIGISYLYNLCNIKVYKSFICIFGSIILINCTVSSLLLVQKSITLEARIDAIQFCKEHGITKENSLYEGYTPFLLNAPRTIKAEVEENGKLALPPGIKYVILSSEMYSRFYSEPNRYVHQIRIYESIKNNNKLIYSAGGPYYTHSNFAIINIFYMLNGLFSHSSNTKSGCAIQIYRVRDNPDK